MRTASKHTFFLRLLDIKKLKKGKHKYKELFSSAKCSTAVYTGIMSSFFSVCLLGLVCVVGGGRGRLSARTMSISGLVNMAANAVAPSLSAVSYNTHFPPENRLSCHTSVIPLRLLLRCLVYMIFVFFVCLFSLYF